MYIYYNKQGILSTAIPHGTPVRQGSDLDIYLCVDSDFFEYKQIPQDQWRFSIQLKFPDGSLSTNFGPDNMPTAPEIFKKTHDSEVTYGLKDNMPYWIYHFHFTPEQATTKFGELVAIVDLSYTELVESSGTASLNLDEPYNSGKKAYIDATYTSSREIKEGDVILYQNEEARVEEVANNECTLAIIPYGEIANKANSIIAVILASVETSRTEYHGNAEIWVEQTFGYNKIKTDESSLHYKNLLSQINYLATLIQRGSSIYSVSGLFEFADGVGNIEKDNIAIPQGKKLLLGDLVVDNQGTVARITSISGDDVTIQYYADFRGTVIHTTDKEEYNQELSAYRTFSYSDKTDTFKVNVGDFILFKNGIIGLVTEVHTSDCYYDIYSATKDIIQLTAESDTAPDLPSNHYGTTNVATPKVGDYAIIIFNKENKYNQKCLLGIVIGVTKNSSTYRCSYQGIKYLDGIRGTKWFIQTTTPDNPLLSDMWLDTSTNDIYQYEATGSGIIIYRWVKKGNIKGDKGDTGESTRWYSGSTPPEEANPYDLFFNTSNNNVYQWLTVSGGGYGWAYQANIKGPQGERGNTIWNGSSSSLAPEINLLPYSVSATLSGTTSSMGLPRNGDMALIQFATANTKGQKYGFGIIQSYSNGTASITITSLMDGFAGEQGVSIESVDIVGGELIVYFSNGTSHDAGNLGSLLGDIIKIVSTLPPVSTALLNVIYLVPKQDSESGDLYDEYICVEKNGTRVWEHIGGVSIDLSDYLTAEQIAQMYIPKNTMEGISSIFAVANGFQITYNNGVKQVLPFADSDSVTFSIENGKLVLNATTSIEEHIQILAKDEQPTDELQDGGIVFENIFEEV